MLCLEDNGRGPCEQDARVQVKDSNHCEHFVVEGRINAGSGKALKGKIESNMREREEYKYKYVYTQKTKDKKILKASCLKGRNTKKWLAAWSILLQASWRSVATHRRWSPSKVFTLLLCSKRGFDQKFRLCFAFFKSF